MVTNGRPVAIHILIPFCFNEHNAFLIFGVISVFPISSNVPSISKKIIFTLFISFLSSSLFSYVLKIVLLGSMSLISAVKRYSALGSKSIRPMDLVRKLKIPKAYLLYSCSNSSAKYASLMQCISDTFYKHLCKYTISISCTPPS